MEIKRCAPKPKASYPLNPKFGTAFTPHMFRMDIRPDQPMGSGAEIVPYAPELFSPSAVVFHYGQAVFEGLKAFAQADGSVGIFRPDLHAVRFAGSCARLAMPVVPESIFLEAVRSFVEFEKESVPKEPNHSLYLRPLLIARDEIVKVGASKSYTFYVLGCVVGNYFASKLTPARLLVNRQFVRACPGGLGEAKTAANYAISLAPQAHAEKHGFDQVLYLDAIHHDAIDELGGMNFFMVRNGELVTPALNGCILNGVTRRSILEIAPKLGLRGREETISFDQMRRDIAAGVVTEAFACGTAAVVHPIGEFGVQETMAGPIEKVALPDQYPVALKLLETLKAMHTGRAPAPGSWVTRI
jgi:branched-chain amino acid aminotransferase